MCGFEENVERAPQQRAELDELWAALDAVYDDDGIVDAHEREYSWDRGGVRFGPESLDVIDNHEDLKVIQDYIEALTVSRFLEALLGDGIEVIGL